MQKTWIFFNTVKDYTIAIQICLDSIECNAYSFSWASVNAYNIVCTVHTQFNFHCIQTKIVCVFFCCFSTVLFFFSYSFFCVHTLFFSYVAKSIWIHVDEIISAKCNISLQYEHTAASHRERDCDLWFELYCARSRIHVQIG